MPTRVHVRPYRHKKHFTDALRIWKEVGWVAESEAAEAEAIVEAGPAAVAELNGEMACIVSSCSAALRYQNNDLPAACVTGVAVSRSARRQGLASAVTASSIAGATMRGAALSVLGMFDQGFYNRLGFGVGSHEIWTDLQPAQLSIPVRHRPPKRITRLHLDALHAARLARRRGHGAVNLLAPGITGAELGGERGFGLGYFKGAVITHAVWFVVTGSTEHGPLRVAFMAWQTPDQFLELMSLIASLGDQYHKVTLREPAGIPLQDFVRSPFATDRVTSGGQHSTGVRARGCWQARINLLPECIDRVSIAGAPIRFNLHLADPLEAHLPPNSAWKGCGGDWTVSLGPDSFAVSGLVDGLPEMEASVGAFTRLWLGVWPASGLAITDSLAAPESLLAELDARLRLPPPNPDWDI